MLDPELVKKFQEAVQAFRPTDLGYGYCPVQIEGLTDDGYDYYFRARGTHWTFQIAETPGQDAADTEPYLAGEINSAFAAGWMPHSLAKALTDWALECWLHDRQSTQPTTTDG